MAKAISLYYAKKERNTFYGICARDISVISLQNMPYAFILISLYSTHDLIIDKQ